AGPERAGSDGAAAALAAAFYVRHNLAVAVLAFALGLPLALGSPALLIGNGVVAGVTAALAVRAGAGARLLAFGAPHAPWELLALFLTAGAGLRVGLALLAPGPRPRLEAALSAAPASLSLLPGAACLFGVAALLEACVSASTLSEAARNAVGAAGVLVVVGGLCLGGRSS